MSSVDLSELPPAIADRIRKGETIEIRDGDKLVGKIIPVQEGPAPAPSPIGS